MSLSFVAISYFLIPIFATGCLSKRYFIFNLGLIYISLKYKMFTPSCSKDIWIRKLDFVKKRLHFFVFRERERQREILEEQRRQVFFIKIWTPCLFKYDRYFKTSFHTDLNSMPFLKYVRYFKTGFHTDLDPCHSLNVAAKWKPVLIVEDDIFYFNAFADARRRIFKSFKI